MAPKIVRVEIETEDGKVIRVTGEEAVRWQQLVDGMSGLSYVHGIQDPGIKWETIRPANGT